MPAENVYGNFRPIDLGAALTEGYTAGLQAKGMKQQQRENEMKLAELGRVKLENEQIRGLYQQHTGQDGTLNKQGFLSDLGKINPEKAMQYQDAFKKRDADDLENKSKKLEFEINQLGAVSNLAMSAKDQPSYEAALQQASKLGLDVSQMPQQFDPGLVQSYAFNSMKQAERLAAEKNEFDKWRDRYKIDQDDQRLGIDRDKAQIEREKAKQEAGKAGLELATKLRTERTGLPTTKTTQDVSAAYNRVQNSAQNPSPAGDMALLFNYMKMLDPGSTVREGEFATARAAASIPEQIRGAWDRVRSGELLTPYQRSDFVNRAQAMYDAQRDQQSKVDRDFERLAIKGGVSPDDVLIDYGANVPTSKHRVGAKQESREGPKKPSSPPKVAAGSVIEYGGKHYTVGADGETLVPVTRKASVK